MNRRTLAQATGGLLVTAAALVTGARAQPAKAHRIVLHVGGPDPALMGTALGNIVNAKDYYAHLGETVQIELVANGPGYAMLRDTSPVKDRIADVHKRFPDVVFSACQQSRKAVAAAEHKSVEDITQLPEATDTPAGVARLTALQEQGWSYIRV